jgi:hypothetical protein
MLRGFRFSICETFTRFALRRFTSRRPDEDKFLGPAHVCLARPTGAPCYLRRGAPYGNAVLLPDIARRQIRPSQKAKGPNGKRLEGIPRERFGNSALDVPTPAAHGRPRRAAMTAAAMRGTCQIDSRRLFIGLSNALPQFDSDSSPAAPARAGFAAFGSIQTDPARIDCCERCGLRAGLGESEVDRCGSPICARAHSSRDFSS